MSGYEGQICLKIKRREHSIVERSREGIVHFSSGPKWKVDCSYGTYVVDLEERSCACRRWELMGIPCIHAMTILLHCRNNPEEYVDN